MKHHETWEKDKEDVKWWNIMTIMRAPCPWRSPRSPWTWHRRMRSIALAPVGSWPSKQLKRFRVLVAPIFKIRIWLIIIRIFMYILYHYILWTFQYFYTYYYWLLLFHTFYKCICCALNPHLAVGLAVCQQGAFLVAKRAQKFLCGASMRGSEIVSFALCYDTVDRRNPAPVDRWLKPFK